MIKAKSHIEHQIGERKFLFICDPETPLQEAKDALFQFIKYIGQIEDDAKAKLEQQAKESESEIVEQVEKE